MMRKVFQKLYLYILLLFLYVPIGVLVVNSFNESRFRAKWGGFTLNWYKELLADEAIMMALYYTIVVALLSAVISTLIGTAASIALSNFKSKRLQKLVMFISYIPVLNPDIVTGISLMLLFLFFKISLGFSTMLIAHITFGIPFVILSVLPKLRQSDSKLYEAALDLGCTPMQALFKVVLPDIKPGIITGFLLAFTMSIDDFVISYFTTASGVSNISIEVYSMARMKISPKVNAVSTIMFVTVLLLMIIVEYRKNKQEKSKVTN